jgi:hypothetical protein
MAVPVLLRLIEDVLGQRRLARVLAQCHGNDVIATRTSYRLASAPVKPAAGIRTIQELLGCNGEASQW